MHQAAEGLRTRACLLQKGMTKTGCQELKELSLAGCGCMAAAPLGMGQVHTAMADIRHDLRRYMQLRLCAKVQMVQHSHRGGLGLLVPRVTTATIAFGRHLCLRPGSKTTVALPWPRTAKSRALLAGRTPRYGLQAWANQGAAPPATASTVRPITPPETRSEA